MREGSAKCNAHPCKHTHSHAYVHLFNVLSCDVKMSIHMLYTNAITTVIKRIQYIIHKRILCVYSICTVSVCIAYYILYVHVYVCAVCKPAKRWLFMFKSLIFISIFNSFRFFLLLFLFHSFFNWILQMAN